jgi:hypothetical protein
VSFQSTVGKLLNRVIVAGLGLWLALLGAGVVLLALDQPDPVSVGGIVAALEALILTVAGARHVYAGVSGRLPKWYAEFLGFAGGVFVGGGRGR